MSESDECCDEPWTRSVATTRQSSDGNVYTTYDRECANCGEKRR